ncbi:MAG: flagellar filament capping protein FliD [Vampirovibrionales bacterium]|nr:flagellar filament capping protein FliD [Vampirovibrionales bacterium]
MGSTINFGGLASGLPVNDIITQLMAIERRPLDLLEQRKALLRTESAQFDSARSRVNGLLDAIKKIKANSVLDSNPFQNKKTLSSNESVATATASDAATPQQVTLRVNKLATATTATSLSGLGQALQGSDALTTLTQRSITTGSFTVYVNGTANDVDVLEGDTFDDVLTRLEGIAGITDASIDSNGKFTLTSSPGNTLKLGSNADTSNFLKATGLATGTLAGNTISGSIEHNTLNLASDISDNATTRLQTAVTAGSTFKIGAATFDTTGKSLGDIIGEINSSTDANVLASYNTATNKLELTNKTTGDVPIFLEDTTGNFLQATGLISGSNTLAAQTFGENADFILNGSQLYSTSNDISETISGLTGITLTLTGEDSGSDLTIDIQRDDTALKSSIEGFVKEYNKVISFIDDQTNAEKGLIKNRSTLVNLRNQLKGALSGLVSGNSEYSSLALVGVSTGAPNSGSSGTASSTLQFNASALDTALASNREEVEQLFVGTEGIFTQLKTLVDGALYDDPENVTDGVFAAQSSASAAKIKDIDDAVARGEARLEAKEKLLRAQFSAMERVIQQFQSQGSSLTGLASQLAANR